jgi:hypothetical protein
MKDKETIEEDENLFSETKRSITLGEIVEKIKEAIKEEFVEERKERDKLILEYIDGVGQKSELMIYGSTNDLEITQQMGLKHQIEKIVKRSEQIKKQLTE